MGFLQLTADDGGIFYANLDRVDCILRNHTRPDRTDLQFIGEENVMIVRETPEEILALLGQSGPLVIENLLGTVRGVLEKFDYPIEREEILDVSIAISDAIRRAALTGGA